LFPLTLRGLKKIIQSLSGQLADEHIDDADYIISLLNIIKNLLMNIIMPADCIKINLKTVL